ncbi:MAG TPA: hypothetical protein VEV15_08145 [Flavisolibacter sp.]|nr:hypothetical protein [Flavisolibacter sp.]
MHYTVFIFFLVLQCSCDNGSFDKDKRQIAAKDAIREQLPRASHHFEIPQFREDTLPAPGGPVFKQVIRYTLLFRYQDSVERVQERTGYVFFTPDGKSIIQLQLSNQDQ